MTASSSAQSAGSLPRWRGFNLSEMFDPTQPLQPFQESDFDIIAEWGFDFVRLPCSYWFWASRDPAKWLQIDDGVLVRTIDQAIIMGRARGIHVSVNMHRIPGWTVGTPPEALNLWTDQRALDAAIYHWSYFAKRYKGIPGTQLSFDLVNEPPDSISTDQYLRVHKALIAAVHQVDPNRLVIAEGMAYGVKPAAGLVGSGAAASTRGYLPLEISHYQAPWMPGALEFSKPTWPLHLGDDTWDRDRLERELIQPFRAVQAQGMGVHVGEFGAYELTPHDVVLSWMGDLLDLWRDAGWGWALWNLRGGFGVLDSNRSDVDYENFRGHRLDRQMLELLRAG